jgi:hypothetical protein
MIMHILVYHNNFQTDYRKSEVVEQREEHHTPENKKLE